jgi:aarF domain-containing kinase
LIYGFIHSQSYVDPHDANILVRKNPKQHGKPQIVLLDHGLYRNLDKEFKQNYTRLWMAILMSDENGIRKYSHKLNAGDTFTLLAAILTMKPWDDIVSNDVNRFPTFDIT